MSRLPQIDITSGEDVLYAKVGKRMAAFMWRAGEYWYVGAPGRAPRSFTNQGDAMKTLMDLAMKERAE